MGGGETRTSGGEKSEAEGRGKKYGSKSRKKKAPRTEWGEGSGELGIKRRKTSPKLGGGGGNKTSKRCKTTLRGTGKARVDQYVEKKGLEPTIDGEEA